MDIESKISEILFFSLLKDGIFNYNILIKSSLQMFNEDKKTELSNSSFEYMCYKIIKNKMLDNNFINMDIAIINYNFLISTDLKSLSSKLKKKHIMIFFQNENTQKWNLILFLNFYEQINNYFNINQNQIMVAKIISSNYNIEEDNFIFISILNKLENVFDFKIQNNMILKIDSIYINKRINTSIFIINLIEELISQRNANIHLYTQQLLDDNYLNDRNNNNNSNNKNSNNNNYLSSLNKTNYIFNDILNIYEKDLKENIINKTIKNKNKKEEKFKNENIKIIRNEIIKNEENKEKKSEIKNNNNNKDDINNEDEKEIIKILENEKNKNIVKRKKLKNKLNTKSINLGNINIYKDFDVIKEEDNESSSSESLLISIKKKNKNNDKLSRTNYNKKYSNKTTKILRNLKVDINPSVFEQINNSSDKKYKSQKRIKVKENILKKLEKAIEEFEIEEQHPMVKKIEINKSKITIKNDNDEECVKSANNKNLKKKNIYSNPNNNTERITKKENINNREKMKIKKKKEEKKIFIDKIIKVQKSPNNKNNKNTEFKKKALTSRKPINYNQISEINDNRKEHNKNNSFQNMKNNYSFINYNMKTNKNDKNLDFNKNIEIDNFININSVYNLFIKNSKNTFSYKKKSPQSNINMKKKRNISSTLNNSQNNNLFSIKGKINNENNFLNEKPCEEFENIDEIKNINYSNPDKLYRYSHFPNIPSMDINNKNMQYFINTIEKSDKNTNYDISNISSRSKKNLIDLKANFDNKNKSKDNFKIFINLKDNDEYLTNEFINSPVIKSNRTKKTLYNPRNDYNNFKKDFLKQDNTRSSNEYNNFDDEKDNNVYRYIGRIINESNAIF